jgi:hypothetical protein
VTDQVRTSGDLRVPFTTALDAFSVPAVVTPPEGTPIETRGIWVSPTTENRPGSIDLKRREPTRILALPLADVPSVPRGTAIVAPEMDGLEARRWRVEGFDRLEVDHVRVIVAEGAP